MQQNTLHIIILLLLAPSLARLQPPSRYFSRPSAFGQKMEQLLEAGEAEAVQKAAEQLIQSQPAPQEQGLALFYLGQAKIQEGFHTQGQLTLEDALSRFRYAGYREGTAVALAELGILALQSGELPQAGRCFQEAEGLAKKLALPKLLYALRYHQALLYSTDISKAVQYLKEGLIWAEVLKDSSKIGAICEELYTQYRYAGQNDSAVAFYQRFIGIKEEQGNTVELIGDYIAYGGYQEQLGNYAEAQRYLIRALEMAESIQDTFSIMSLYTNIGAVFKAQKDWGNALSYSRKAAAMARLRNIRGIEAVNLKNQADVLSETGQPGMAASNYQQALKIFLELNQPIAAAEAQISLLKMQEQGHLSGTDDTERAIKILTEALTIRKKINDRANMLHTQLVLARLELFRGEYGRAEALLLEALEWSTEMESQSSRVEAYSLLARARAGMGDFQRAYHFQEQLRIVQDSILSRQNTSIVQELEVKYQAEKKDRALAERQARAEQLEAEIQKKYYQVVLLAVGSILASLIACLLFFLFRYNKRLHLHRLEIIRKEQETRHLQAVIEGEEKERKRLAHELHDGLGAVLATAKMQISALSDNVPAVQLSHSYSKAEHLLDEACRSVREISHNLTPDILEQNGLEFALHYLCESIAKAHGLETDFIPFGLEADIPEPASIAVYRITQELLKNITQHSGARSVIVQAALEDGWLHLIVEDDGRGFELNGDFAGGIGLFNMRSRVSYLGGRLSVESQPGQGSTFCVDLPVGGRE